MQKDERKQGWTEENGSDRIRKEKVRRQQRQQAEDKLNKVQRREAAAVLRGIRGQQEHKEGGE
jgi:hypothetical protein